MSQETVRVSLLPEVRFALAKANLLLIAKSKHG